MALIRIKPTRADVAIADGIAARTRQPAEHVAEAVTWGADEHVLCALAFGWWLYARTRDEPVRRSSNHILLTTLAASALPHALKAVFDQQRNSLAPVAIAASLPPGPRESMVAIQNASGNEAPYR